MAVRKKKPLIVNGVEHWLCPTCGLWFPAGGFYRHKRNRNGLSGQCRICHRNGVKKTRNAKQQAIRSSERRRERGDLNPRYSPRDFARMKVSKAVKRGVLVRPTACSKCGDGDRKVFAHHPDYSKPLEVVWLCQPCHTRLHHGTLKPDDVLRRDLGGVTLAGRAR